MLLSAPLTLAHANGSAVFEPAAARLRGVVANLHALLAQAKAADAAGERGRRRDAEPFNAAEQSQAKSAEGPR